MPRGFFIRIQKDDKLRAKRGGSEKGICDVEMVECQNYLITS